MLDLRRGRIYIFCPRQVGRALEFAPPPRQAPLKQARAGRCPQRVWRTPPGPVPPVEEGEATSGFVARETTRKIRLLF